MKVTADTITDEQIRGLLRSLKRDLQRARKLVGPYGNPQVDILRIEITTCTVALTDPRAMAYMMPGVAEGVRNSRARCAEIWNARHAKESA